MPSEETDHMAVARAAVEHGEFAQTRGGPTADADYFAQMTKAIARAGLNWKVIENKWDGYMAAFEGFNIDIVARYGEDDIERLMADAGIVRNRKKILSTITNAEEIQGILAEYGSFQDYLKSLIPAGEQGAIKELSKRFAHLGPSTSAMFLWMVGYDMPEHAAYMLEKYGDG
ncbi:MAG: DNA-3-methyladenine glycosylase I [Chloroflexota bacterium]|jgi:DNA-3-methyladenine glycosylase I|nr:DNA-3-methyladenine glycosylase I [Chloroflexota bacterium]MDP6508629.1 DNA-3-methyladenine glycosylase I [Chloroflexota bacterium]MDP6758377.1 DNA-3-methyladenine glycosylase I [Chloroflexota bacterium]